MWKTKGEITWSNLKREKRMWKSYDSFTFHVLVLLKNVKMNELFFILLPQPQQKDKVLINNLAFDQI